MQYALPHPSRSIAIPLATLVLGAAGGATVAAIVSDDDVIRLPAVNQPAAVQSDSSFTTRPQEGTAVRSINNGPQTAGLSERTSGNPQPVGGVTQRPSEGAAINAMKSSPPSGLSEKSSDPSVQPSGSLGEQNTLGARP